MYHVVRQDRESGKWIVIGATSLTGQEEGTVFSGGNDQTAQAYADSLNTVHRNDESMPRSPK
jgi:hypothetical protein